jgi:succinoglycan biosynthesis transport protein ExoP
MNVNQFLSILWARRWLALSVFLLTIGATIVVSLLLPKKYTASAAVVVEMKGDPIVGMLFQNIGGAAYLGTQVDIFNSDRVARRVVSNLKLNENATIRQQWLEQTQGQGSFDAWLANTLKAGLVVLPSRESSLINISYTAGDANFAATMANGFMQAYLDTVLDLRVDPAKQYSTFFDSRAKELRDQLEQAQSKLSAYQKQHGIIASDERLDIETSRLNELSSQLVALQAISAESTSRNAQAQGASADRIQEVIGNPLISNIRGDLARAEARFQELTSRLGDAHPQVVEARANITELRSRLAQETRRVTSGVGVAHTINRAREAESRASLEAQRTKVLKMKETRDEGSVLIKDVENAQRAYDQVLARRNQTSLESQTTQTNVTPLTQATVPVMPSSPRIVFNALLSLVVGTLLAIGSVMLLEIVDRRVRGARDLTESLGLPMLGVLPRPARRRSLFHKPTTPLLAQRVLGGHLPNPAKGA